MIKIVDESRGTYDKKYRNARIIRPRYNSRVTPPANVTKLGYSSMTLAKPGSRVYNVETGEYGTFITTRKSGNGYIYIIDIDKEGKRQVTMRSKDPGKLFGNFKVINEGDRLWQ